MSGRRDLRRLSLALERNPEVRALDRGVNLIVFSAAGLCLMANALYRPGFRPRLER